jgi:hypothetical protein
LSSDLARLLVTDFLKHSWNCVETFAKKLVSFNKNKGKSVNLFYVRNGEKKELTVGGEKLFLRASVEYSNPQLTVEEVQGIIAARLIEACGNYYQEHNLSNFEPSDVDAICEILSKPQQGKIMAFLLNTDDVEPDRYSMNPLRGSIVDSGQSAFPSVYVKTDELAVDPRFVEKYDGSLISKDETELIARCLNACKGNYMDMVDAVKYEQLEDLSNSFGIELSIPSLRMPISTLQKEDADGPLHHIIRRMHTDYSAIARVYACIGRSMKNRTTLLTIPHSRKGYGSKRAAKGKIYFDGMKLKSIKIDYETTRLYPNAMDPDDVSIAKAEDHFVVEGEKLVNYDFRETPSSPQFFLYSLASPEDAVIWHGIGAFGASQLLKSYMTTRLACSKNSSFADLTEKYGIPSETGPQFNLVPDKVWFHPIHRNIDASIGTIQNLKSLVDIGMRIEALPSESYIRS